MIYFFVHDLLLGERDFLRVAYYVVPVEKVVGLRVSIHQFGFLFILAYEPSENSIKRVQ